MGIYEFKCKSENCDKFDIIVEILQNINEKHCYFCPSCNSECARHYGSMQFELRGTEWVKPRETLRETNANKRLFGGK